VDEATAVNRRGPLALTAGTLFSGLPVVVALASPNIRSRCVSLQGNKMSPSQREEDVADSLVAIGERESRSKKGRIVPSLFRRSSTLSATNST
jgi:hypothetical protein